MITNDETFTLDGAENSLISSSTDTKTDKPTTHMRTTGDMQTKSKKKKKKRIRYLSLIISLVLNFFK